MRTPLWTLATLLCLLAVPVSSDEPGTTTFELERLNGTYTDLGGEPREIKNGPITVRPSSSANTFQLLGNRLQMTPLGERRHDAEFWVRFEGKADVQTEILMAGFSAGTLQDHVIVPTQERTIEMRLEVQRREQDYLITVIESPRDFDITVQSRLGGQIVSMCETLTRFTFGSSCDGLEAALSNPKVPMPEPGKELVLEAAQLTVEERSRLDAYLASHS